MEDRDHIPHYEDPTDKSQLIVWDGKKINGAEGKRFENIVLNSPNPKESEKNSRQDPANTFEKLRQEEPPLPTDSDSGAHFKGTPVK